MPIQKTALTATADFSRIVQGEALTITVEIADKYTGQALDIDSASAVTATFAGTTANVVRTLGSGVTLSTQPGRLTVALTSVNTAALKIGEAQGWQVEITANGETRIVQLEDALDVVATLF